MSETEQDKLVKRAITLIEKLGPENKALKSARVEPIAVIGMGCRLPGGVYDAGSYWNLLDGGVDAIVGIPGDRWNVDDYFDPEQKTAGKVYVREGGYLDTNLIQGFDPGFFGITPREAVSMDPQQRVLLEVMWEAFEDAGIVVDDLRDSLTGVYVAMMFNDYYQYMLKFSSDKEIDIYSSTGNDFGVAAGRLSYVLGLQGPCIAVNTTCSSSLVTTHMAVAALRAGECNIAVAGGVNVLMAPEMYISLSDGGALAPDCRCKTFDAGANGYVRGEGGGIIILKRLSDAQRDGDRIHAVIRGSAVNHDGRASGLTVPNGKAQEALIRTALQSGEIEPSEIDYVECHGTGTPLGDPIEYNALKAVLKEGREADHPLTIGSVKTNIGHLETAAGIAGLLKVILSLQNEQIPKNLNFQSINPKIELDKLPARVAEKPIQWAPNGKKRLGGVSSFGLSGTNAHVILEEAPPRELIVHPADDERIHILPLSAKSPEALRELAGRYRDRLTAGWDVDFTDLCFTAAKRRAHHSERMTVAFRNREELLAGVTAAAAGDENVGLFIGQAAEETPGTAFVASGQGPKFWPVDPELLAEPVFRDTLEKCDAILKKIGGWSLLEKLTTDEDRSDMDRTEFTQPGLCSVQIALFELWKSRGVEPNAVVGHSMGEVPAAYMCGALSLEDAMLVIYHRGRLIQTLTGGKGKMAFVDLPRADTEEFLKGYEGKLSIAATNSPGNAVISGDADAVREVVATMESKDVFVRLLESVDFASHSSQMEAIQKDLAEACASIKPRASTAPFYSTVAGDVVPGEKLGPDYWAENIRQPVLFSTSIQKLLEADHSIFLEIAPHPALSGSVSQCIAAAEKTATAVPSQNRKEEKMLYFSRAMGSLHALGYPLDWDQFFPDGGNLVSLPANVWQRQKFWVNVDPDKQIIGPGGGAPAEVSRPEDWLYEPVWEQDPSLFDVGGESDSVDPGVVLLFADSEGFAEDMAGLLKKSGLTCLVVKPGKKFETNGNVFTIRPDRRQDYENVIQEVLGSGTPLRNILHFWNLDAPLSEKITVENLESASLNILGSLLFALQSVVNKEQAPKFFIFTRGVHHPEGSGIPQISQSPVWGLGRVIEKENPELWGGLVDLDSKPESLQAAAQVVLHPEAEDQVVVRSGKRYHARLKQVALSDKTEPLALSPEGCYIITGGLGSIGVELAKWMISRGAKKLVLPGRTRLPHRSTWNQEHEERLAGRIRSVQELESLGAEVNVTAVDIASEDQVVKFLDELDKDGWFPVKGVVHSAAVLDSRPLVNLDPAQIGPTLQPKIQGAWLLHKHVDSTGLDFFVEFSSLASVLGDFAEFAGMYPPGNAFNDSLAHFRRMRGYTALSINWGFWKETEFGDSPEGKGLLRKLQGRGISGFTPAEAFEVLERLLKKGGAAPAQVFCLPANWKIMRKSGVSERELRFYSNQFEMLEGEEESGSEEEGAVTLETLGEATPEDRAELLQTYLQDRVAGVMRLAPDQIETGISVKSMGVDSIMALELRKRVSKDLTLNLPVVKILDGSSIVDMVKLLSSSLPAAAATAASKKKGKDSPRTQPLSENQAGLWFLNKLSPSSAGYNVNLSAQIISEIEVEALRAAFQWIMDRYDHLRANFLNDKGVPVQMIRPRREADFEVFDASEWNQREITDAQNREVSHKFLLESEPLIRLRLFTQSSHAHIMVLNSHRILLDPHSLHILWNELLMLYESIRLNNPTNLDDIGKTFSHFVQDEREYIGSGEYNDHHEFWMERMAGDLPVLDPPSEGPRPPIRTYQGGTVRSRVPRENGGEFLKTDDKFDTFAFLLASFLVLIYRSTENSDILIGFPGSLRTVEGYDDAIGNFINPIVLRFQLNDEMTFTDLFEHAKERTKEALENRRYPFQRLVQNLGPLRYPARSPLFQIMFDMDFEEREPEQLIGSLSANWIDLEPEDSPYELMVQITDGPDTVGLKLKYKEDFYSNRAVEQSLSRFNTIIKNVGKNPGIPIKEITYKSSVEISRLEKWNETERDVSYTSLQKLFGSLAGEVPGAIAAELDGDFLTYRQLEGLSNRLADILTEKGVQKGDTIPFLMERRPAMLVVLLGILKAGGICVPLDPALSEPRLLAYLEDCKSKLMIVDAEMANLPANVEALVYGDLDVNEDGSGNGVAVDPADTAFLLYTFQNELTPSGVMLSHRALQNAIQWQVENSRMGIGARTLQINSVNSNAFLQEVFSTLCSGGSLVFTGREALEQDLSFVEWLVEYQLERIFIPLANLESISVLANDQGILPVYLRELVVVGERGYLSQNVVNFLERIPACQLYYHFGMLECPIMTSFTPEELTTGWPNQMPIGRPIDNMHTYILNSAGDEQVAVGLEGDLYLEGPGLADGYFGQDEETARRFIDHPLSVGGGKLFKTNYIARYHGDGSITVIGPSDATRRVNIRGIDINLEEIETALEQHPGIRQSYVMQHPDVGNNGLLAYIVSDQIVDRMVMLIKCEVHYTHNNKKKKELLITQDISSSGLSLQGVPAEWTKGMDVKLRLILPGGEDELELDGIVAWLDGTRAGIRYKEIKAPDKAMLKVTLTRIIEVEQMSLATVGQTEFRVPLRRHCKAIPKDGPPVDLTTEELSNTGISVLNVPLNWQLNKRVVIDLKLPGIFQSIRLNCVLSWRDGARTGFNFRAEDEEFEKLDKFFMHYARNQMLTIAHLRSYLKERLPYFFIPEIFVIIDSLPQLPDGKVNARNLKFPVSKWYNQDRELDPRTPVEGLVHLIWETEFEKMRTGAQDSTQDSESDR